MRWCDFIRVDEWCGSWIIILFKSFKNLNWWNIFIWLCLWCCEDNPQWSFGCLPAYLYECVDGVHDWSFSLLDELLEDSRSFLHYLFWSLSIGLWFRVSVFLYLGVDYVVEIGDLYDYVFMILMTWLFGVVCYLSAAIFWEILYMLFKVYWRRGVYFLNNLCYLFLNKTYNN